MELIPFEWLSFQYPCTGAMHTGTAKILQAAFSWPWIALCTKRDARLKFLSIAFCFQGLVAGDTVAGIAGGVNAQMLPITTCTICGLSALSREARCKTFEATADGYGRGEAFAGM